MANNPVPVRKTVYNKEHINKVVKREFTTFTQPVLEDTQLTIEDFFALYEELFYEIPINGDAGTHEYLIKRSSELYKLDDSTADIQPLLDEITNLRAQIIDNESEIIELQEQVANQNVKN
jgi:hypothetical protein